MFVTLENEKARIAGIAGIAGIVQFNDFLKRVFLNDYKLKKY
jgi:hypothetical protein